VGLRDANTGEELHRYRGHTSAAIGVAFSPDGEFAASTGWDFTARLWEVGAQRPERRFAGHANTLEQVNFSPDGKLALTGSADGTVILWDAQTAR
jgi:WD40 repeat protein